MSAVPNTLTCLSLVESMNEPLRKPQSEDLQGKLEQRRLYGYSGTVILIAWWARIYLNMHFLIPYLADPGCWEGSPGGYLQKSCKKRPGCRGGLGKISAFIGISTLPFLVLASLTFLERNIYRKMVTRGWKVFQVCDAPYPLRIMEFMEFKKYITELLGPRLSYPTSNNLPLLSWQERGTRSVSWKLGVKVCPPNIKLLLVD